MPHLSPCDTAHVLEPQHICVQHESIHKGCKIDFPCQQLAPCSVHSWSATCTCQPKGISYADLHFPSGPEYGDDTRPRMGPRRLSESSVHSLVQRVQNLAPTVKPEPINMTNKQPSPPAPEPQTHPQTVHIVYDTSCSAWSLQREIQSSSPSPRSPAMPSKSNGPNLCTPRRRSMP